MSNRTLNARETAEMFNVTEAVIYNWIGQGLPHKTYKFGRSVGRRFDPEEVKVWLDDRRSNGDLGKHSMKGNDRPICQECHWFGTGSKTCDYFLRTGKQRGCVPTNAHCEMFLKRGATKVPGSAYKEKWSNPAEERKFREYMDKHEARIKRYIYDLRRETY